MLEVQRPRRHQDSAGLIVSVFFTTAVGRISRCVAADLALGGYTTFTDPDRNALNLEWILD
jgi:hypothetical protein